MGIFLKRNVDEHVIRGCIPAYGPQLRYIRVWTYRGIKIQQRQKN